jgi:cytochrome P450
MSPGLTATDAVHTAIEIPEPDRHATITTESLLAEIALDLYRLAAGRGPVIPLPFTVIAVPTIATAVLRDEHRFAKEYRFLELLAEGRFTANGPAWRRRAALTQPLYRQAPEAVGESVIEQIYTTALQRKVRHPETALFECFVDGAVGVISTCLGLAEPLPWPAKAVARARKALKIPLCVSLCGHGAESVESVRETLAAFFREIENVWRDRDDVQSVLQGLATDGRGITGFNPVGELIQNVMAATETTASALMWCVECMARFPECRSGIDSPDTNGGLESFIDEVLRLFPPIPMVMRRCTDAGVVDGLAFQTDDVIAISFVGLHCHPSHWATPLAFDPYRDEWRRPQAERNAYFPFSTGPRICGGARLALMEMRGGIRAFTRLFATLEFAGPLAIDYSLTSRPHPRIEDFVQPLSGAGG